MEKKKGGGCVIFLLVIFILAGIGSLIDVDNSEKCDVCGRTYTNSDDVSSIKLKGMCEPCYEDYEFRKELKEELKKYEERNS